MDEDSILQLKDKVRGELVRPGDASYDEMRKVYNGMYDRRPALILLASGFADVMTAIRFAREQNLVLAIRGGGHSAPGFGTCDDGLVIDLRRMRSVRLDPERKTVRAEGGCTLGDICHSTYAFGLATPVGIASTTGIAGLTLGGGLGYLMRRYGLTCDNLISADVVTADGSFITCSAEREPDLFWALRGGGGNFGVVTSFEFLTHPVGDIFGGPTFFALDGNVLSSFRDFVAKAPREFGGLFGFTMAAPLPFIQEKWHGKPVCAVIACWSGPPDKGEQALAPIKKWGEVVGQYVDRMPYPIINTLFDALLPPGLQNYWTGNFSRELPEGAIKAHIEHAAKVPCIESSTLIYPMDGACREVPVDATAYANRDSMFSTVIGGAWPDPADNDRNKRWVDEYYQALRPFSEEAGYVNFMAGEDQDRVGANYGPNYTRLVELKTKYDPTNLFRINHNIAPAS